MQETGQAQDQRKAWLGLLARAPADAVAQAWAALGLVPAYRLLRAPEIGAVMVRGRAGAVGAPFNLGEMTVTRASVALDCGTVGHGYVQGRGRDHALQAALVDALLQTAAADQVTAKVLVPLRRAEAARQSARASRAAATKVDFFTLVRGED